MSGSFERFIAILIEHFAGAFPVWLAPEQVRVLPISDEVSGYAHAVTAKLRAAGIRAVCDERSDTLNYRIRDGEIMKVPYMAVGRMSAPALRRVALRRIVALALAACALRATVGAQRWNGPGSNRRGSRPRPSSAATPASADS
ncbi:MAG: hypothetical protein IPJ78_19640 [Gemmatimonadetes bacterium]|nr:hypothetical protein [Gemmatimonadota bacterium]